MCSIMRLPCTVKNHLGAQKATPDQRQLIKINKPPMIKALLFMGRMVTLYGC